MNIFFNKNKNSFNVEFSDEEKLFMGAFIIKYSHLPEEECVIKVAQEMEKIYQGSTPSLLKTTNIVQN